MNMASTSKLEIQSSAIGPVIQGDHNLIVLRDSHVTQQSEQIKTDVIEKKLYAAVDKWNVDLVKQLIVEDGVDVNVTNDSNQTPLEALLATVTPECNDKIIRSTVLRSTIAVLLEHGASVNADKLFNEHAFLLLSSALKSNKLDLLESLLKQGLDVNSTNRWDQRVLDEAAELGSYEAVKMLVTHGADTDRLRGSSYRHDHPVFKLIEHIVIKKRNIDQEVIEMLELLNCKKFVSSEYGGTMLNLAARGLHAELIELLINTYGIYVNNHTPLHVLIWSLDESADKEEVTKAVQTLIRCGASLTITDVTGRTPLQLLKDQQEKHTTYNFQDLIAYLTSVTPPIYQNQNHTNAYLSSLTSPTSQNQNHTNENKCCSTLIKRKKMLYNLIVVPILIIAYILYYFYANSNSNK